MAKANTLHYAQLLQTTLDKQVVAQATSGWMELNSSMVKYNGGNEVKIPKLTMDALGDYDRTNGFVDGAVTLSWQTRELTQDRGRSFSIDRMDLDETAFVPTAATVMGEFQRTKVIPEIDAYRYSYVGSKSIAEGKNREYDPSEADILKQLKADIYDIHDIAGEIPLIITLSTKVLAMLDNSEELKKQLSVIDFVKGELKTKVRAIDINPIISAPSARMKTSYLFSDGKTAGQEGGGFKPAEDAKELNWIICPRQAVIGVSKTDKIRIFTPDENQKADAWKLDYRKYHDAWILDNQFDLIRTSTRKTV